ncbi:LOW QUALITY PROTEIN: protein PBDC1-like [Amphiura filiformis]|uniref:LOW QUALITY PROTEIN: protein PBDC1-like n=1 Tax=Amphiura filiformis TaxID=82378 RepID=UPI003B20DC75
MDLGSLGVDGMRAAAGALSGSADSYQNEEEVELHWAIKAYHHAETYYNLISSVDNRKLKLSKHDDEIYEQFRKDFPDFDVKVLSEEELKSGDAKTKWRPFCNHFDGQVEDFNFGTLLRLDCTQDYSEKNSIFVTRIQFFAIEIARNREGYNLCNWNKKPEIQEETTETKKSETKEETTETKDKDVTS